MNIDYPNKVFTFILLGICGLQFLLSSIAFFQGVRFAILPVVLNGAILIGFYKKAIWFPTIVKLISVLFIISGLTIWLVFILGGDLPSVLEILRRQALLFVGIYFLYSLRKKPFFYG